MTPNNTNAREKKTLIARTATTNSAALGSMNEYQFQALGTKKCQMPKPMDDKLPMITNIFTSKLIFLLPYNFPHHAHSLDRFHQTRNVKCHNFYTASDSLVTSANLTIHHIGSFPYFLIHLVDLTNWYLSQTSTSVRSYLNQNIQDKIHILFELRTS